MALSIADQIALDDALVAPTDLLKIEKCNLRLSSDITSKEATLQVVYDVLKLTPFYKAFQVTADAPEIYMQEFWASAYVHNRSVRFKMNNKKHIIGLEQFRDILQICPLETEIIIFLASLGHSGDIRKLSDVNVNKLHQPWRSFAAPSYDSLRLSQAQILWDSDQKFKEGDFHRLRIQDIEDMLLLLVQGKVTNLDVEERIAFNVSLRMFTRRVVIQRRVEDLQLGVESYQKKLTLTKPDTYRSNLRRQDAYTPYCNISVFS
ncbi:hypothetical protein Tco_0075489, partial [Tanacetum coccineum]